MLMATTGAVVGLYCGQSMAQRRDRRRQSFFFFLAIVIQFLGGVFSFWTRWTDDCGGARSSTFLVVDRHWGNPDPPQITRYVILGETARWSSAGIVHGLFATGLLRLVPVRPLRTKILSTGKKNVDNTVSRLVLKIGKKHIGDKFTHPSIGYCCPCHIQVTSHPRHCNRFGPKENSFNKGYNDLLR